MISNRDKKSLPKFMDVHIVSTLNNMIIDAQKDGTLIKIEIISDYLNRLKAVSIIYDHLKTDYMIVSSYGLDLNVKDCYHQFSQGIDHLYKNKKREKNELLNKVKIAFLNREEFNYKKTLVFLEEYKIFQKLLPYLDCGEYIPICNKVYQKSVSKSLTYNFDQIFDDKQSEEVEANEKEEEPFDKLIFGSDIEKNGEEQKLDDHYFDIDYIFNNEKFKFNFHDDYY